ncbi:two-component system, OmpR family, sensor histidine kinase ChvG [Altererythrobacter xiamenensis]|uniref:histidine kinase n=1 Tax=Altererythrobacter xiamenensis TaxID=1316679 RepID=A0A1Y6EF00_9SPHN|nr:HAMP domain-containing sensor histidine kinase [Altererythrobacter xiamenensis]SMQ61188.1 two-component system, OmpR family, sensor histidine kinase ChvG [Altererythrobacter xiamenensis]
MADELPANRLDRGLERLTWSGKLSLTSRILAVNLLPLLLLGGGLFYLDSYRTQLLNERYKLARIEAQITAEALAGASRERQEALLIQIGKEQRMRMRMFDAEGRLWADSFALDEEPSFQFDDITDDSWDQRFARWLDRAVDTIVSAEPVTDYVEPEAQTADAWPELVKAREEGLSQITLYDWRDGTPVITAAAPVGLNGATLLTTRNAVDITESVRSARSTLGLGVLLVLTASILLSLFLARTIIAPLRLLSRAAMRVRQGREREVEVPRLPERRDEIGLLARAVSDMTGALRHRIDAVESFAADVAHEIKNPLASLRSAIESLPRVEDPELRRQLVDIATHDVRRIDRLVTEISDASRIDAEMSRATLETIDLADLVEAIVGSREARAENRDHRIELKRKGWPSPVTGVATRLERVVENLLDNAVSFSPPDAPIEVEIGNVDDRVVLTVCDRGPGIPEDSREKVFRRFHSVRPEAEDFGNHSGLGLAIARTIAEAHDGSLIAAGRSDGKPGACLRLELPAAQ